MCTDARQMAQASGLSHKYLEFSVLCVVHNADWRSEKPREITSCDCMEKIDLT